MENSRRRAVVFVIPLIVGLTAAFRLTPDVRTVDFLQIYASGALLGVGIVGFIQVLRKKSTP